MLFFATITQQRRPRCCLFVVRLVLVVFKEEEEEEEEAILVGVVDDVVATENMMTMMMILLRVCVFMCVYALLSARRYNGEIDTFSPHKQLNSLLKLRAFVSACQRGSALDTKARWK